MNAQIDMSWVEARILHALTEYDKKQAKKTSYNRHALGIYCGALNEWRADKNTSTNPIATLPRYFTTLRDEGEWFHITTINKAVKEIRAKYPTL